MRTDRSKAGKSGSAAGRRLVEAPAGGCLIVAIGLILLATACAGRRPTDLGVRDGLLAPCPASPNCVSSDAADEDHLVAPIRIEGSVWDAWAALRQLLETTPRVRIVALGYEYVHAEFKSRLMGYVDDVEFVLRADERAIAVRSASRLGYGDLDANRQRIEWIREELVERGHARGSGG